MNFTSTLRYFCSVSSSATLAGLIYNNAGFSELKNIPELELYEGRYDPAVIPLAGSSSSSSTETTLTKIGSSSSGNMEKGDAPSNSTGHSSAYAYHEAYKTGKLTPTAVAETILELISQNRHHGNAFADMKKNVILNAAKDSTQRYKDGKPLGPLDGVPVTVKDEVDIVDHKKTIGSTKEFTDPRNITSWCVTQWISAGAIVIGKTNMQEMGLDTNHNNPRTYTPLNPHNTSYYTGGSSGGSAYAVSAGLLPIAHGVDGGGSIRIPSSFCGLYGLKPTHRRVSRHPSLSLAASNSCDGPMACCMADLELAYRLMATVNPSDTHNSLFPPQPTTISASLPPPVDKIIGIYDAWNEAAEPGVSQICQRAIDFYTSPEGGNYRIQKIHIPHLERGQGSHAITILSEVSTGLRATNLSVFSGHIKMLLSIGRYVPGMDLLAAQKLRNLLMQHLSWLWRTYPGMLIVTPTTTIPGWHIAGGKADLNGGISDANTSLKNMTYVWLANFTGVPAITVPVGMADPVGNNDKEDEGDGKIPVGLMAMAEWGAEESLIRFGKEGEAWAWKSESEGGGGVKRPGGNRWVNVMDLATKKM